MPGGHNGILCVTLMSLMHDYDLMHVIRLFDYLRCMTMCISMHVDLIEHICNLAILGMTVLISVINDSRRS